MYVRSESAEIMDRINAIMKISPDSPEIDRLYERYHEARKREYEEDLKRYGKPDTKA